MLLRYTKVRFFFPPPGGFTGELSPSQQADLKPSPTSFVKKSHEEWKGGRTFGGERFLFVDEAGEFRYVDVDFAH